MSIKNRLGKIRDDRNQIFGVWIRTLSDGDLERFVERHGDDDGFAEWLKTLTDDELETICFNKPGAHALLGNF